MASSITVKPFSVEKGFDRERNVILSTEKPWFLCRFVESKSIVKLFKIEVNEEDVFKVVPLSNELSAIPLQQKIDNSIVTISYFKLNDDHDLDKGATGIVILENGREFMLVDFIFEMDIVVQQKRFKIRAPGKKESVCEQGEIAQVYRVNKGLIVFEIIDTDNVLRNKVQKYVLFHVSLVNHVWSSDTINIEYLDEFEHPVVVSDNGHIFTYDNETVRFYKHKHKENILEEYRSQEMPANKYKEYIPTLFGFSDDDITLLYIDASGNVPRSDGYISWLNFQDGHSKIQLGSVTFNMKKINMNVGVEKMFFDNVKDSAEGYDAMSKSFHTNIEAIESNVFSRYFPLGDGLVAVQPYSNQHDHILIWNNRGTREYLRLDLSKQDGDEFNVFSGKWIHSVEYINDFIMVRLTDYKQENEVLAIYYFPKIARDLNFGDIIENFFHPDDEVQNDIIVVDEDDTFLTDELKKNFKLSSKESCCYHIIAPIRNGRDPTSGLEFFVLKTLDTRQECEVFITKFHDKTHKLCPWISDESTEIEHYVPLVVKDCGDFSLLRIVFSPKGFHMREHKLKEANIPPQFYPFFDDEENHQELEITNLIVRADIVSSKKIEDWKDGEWKEISKFTKKEHDQQGKEFEDLDEPAFEFMDTKTKLIATVIDLSQKRDINDSDSEDDKTDLTSDEEEEEELESDNDKTDNSSDSDNDDNKLRSSKRQRFKGGRKKDIKVCKECGSQKHLRNSVQCPKFNETCKKRNTHETLQIHERIQRNNNNNNTNNKRKRSNKRAIAINNTPLIPCKYGIHYKDGRFSIDISNHVHWKDTNENYSLRDFMNKKVKDVKIDQNGILSWSLY
jgi:hypothetical protein